MTKSTITREENIQAVFDLKAGYTLGFADVEILKRVARIALAAMDGEPDYNERQLFCSTDTARMKKVISASAGTEATPLYRHAQQPVVPDESYQQLSELYHAQEKRLFKIAQRIKGPAFDKYSHSPSQAIDVLEVAIFGDDESCRAAMLQAGSPPAQSDCCPEQNSVAPAQSPIEHGYRPECECSGCKATARICAELSANSSANPDCWCCTCRPVVLNDMRFVVCPDCGNKRCPRANDHRNACTGSNEPGQEGSAYPAAPQSPGSEPATVPGKWIPVSERMPENDGAYLCWDNRYVTTYAFIFGAWQANQFIAKNITHWMPLPAGPQEVR